MKKQNPKISIIVPVYKAEKYLCKCVDSLLAQTFTDFEVLLIDDGSPDDSGKICDEYSIKDRRIRVFHKENEGVASARQMGIDNAKGEYTIHVDPDDWVEPEMLKDLYSNAIEEDADMVICDYFSNTGKKQKYVQQKPSDLNHEIVLRDLFQHLHGSCWNKLVKRFCFSRYSVKYIANIDRREDLLVNLQLLLNPIKIAYVNQAYYHYEQEVNENTLSRQFRFIDYQRNERCNELIKNLLSNQLKNSELEVVCIKLEKDQALFALIGNIISHREYKERYVSLQSSLSVWKNVRYFDLYIRLALINFMIGRLALMLRLKLGVWISRIANIRY